jgi:hypothetical protein
MSIEQMRADALNAGKNAPRNLKMIRRNPEIIKPGKLAYAVSYLEAMKRFAKEEMKNARRAGRTKRGVQIKELVKSILSQNERSVNQKL